MLYYYNAAPQLRRIADQLELALYEAKGRKISRRRECAKHPGCSGLSPDEIEADTLRKAINQALFALQMLHN